MSHPRTAAMFRGNPGEDFQCRCSMVMWDPEIDGDYEVKDSDLLERREAERKAEAAEREKGLQTALKKAERKAEILRKANERLANRTPLDRERSAYTYYGRHPDAVFRKNKCDTIEQAFLSISELDIARQYAGEKTFFRNGNLRYTDRLAKKKAKER